MRVYSFIVVMVLAAIQAGAQGTAGLSGRIVDEHSQPVAGARIDLAPGPNVRRVISDEDGHFEFRAMLPGRYTLAIQRIGYQPRQTDIDVPASGTKANIVLVAIPRVLDSVRIVERANRMRYSGTVLDERGAPIPDVAVDISGVDNTIRTDSAGHFVVPKNVHGALIIRMRKIGFGAFFSSVSMYGERNDTLRMSRLAQGLSAVEIDAASGFGRDSFAYKDLDQRMRWRNHFASVLTREKLNELGRSSLCPGCSGPRPCVILNGIARTVIPAAGFFADEVETVEVYPPKSDWSGNLAARGCGGNVLTWVVWERKDIVRKP